MILNWKRFGHVATWSKNDARMGCSALIRISMHCVRIAAQTMTANVSLTISIDRAQSRPFLLDRFARLQISRTTPRKSSLRPISKSITCFRSVELYRYTTLHGGALFNSDNEYKYSNDLDIVRIHETLARAQREYLWQRGAFKGYFGLINVEIE